MAILKISDLCVNAIIGTLQHERTEKQQVLISADIEYDASYAIKTDSIDHALDYDALVRTIIEKIGQGNFYLIEKLADTVLNIITSDSKVKSAKVTVVKPKAVKEAREISIELKS